MQTARCAVVITCRPVAVIAVGIGVWCVVVIAIVAVVAVTAIGTGVAVIATIAVGAMIDVVMPAIAVDRPIVQQTAVAIMLHGGGVARSEERRVGYECVSTGELRVWPES